MEDDDLVWLANSIGRTIVEKDPQLGKPIGAKIPTVSTLVSG
jgi:hypothetical protein